MNDADAGVLRRIGQEGTFLGSAVGNRHVLRRVHDSVRLVAGEDVLRWIALLRGPGEVRHRVMIAVIAIAELANEVQGSDRVGRCLLYTSDAADDLLCVA